MMRKLSYPYRLGLDIGTNSIGWCLLRIKDSAPAAIIKMGVRIFSNGRNPKDGTSLAVTRRMARAMRRRRDRLLKRKNRLLDALVQHNFFPSDPIERKQCIQLDPYQLRQKGLYEPLSGKEFARALFHINQRRGFLSNRKTDKQDKENSVLKGAITELNRKLQEESCLTLGDWLAKRHAQGLSVRARLHGTTSKNKAYDFYVNRAMIENEFDILWEKQTNFNPKLFNDIARNELKDILLYQRPLLPVEPGRCTLIPEEKRAPLALPSSQLFRVYQEVNNLRIKLYAFTTRAEEAQPLNKAQRDKVVELLNSKAKISFTTILKTLKLPREATFNLEDSKRDHLKGNITATTLSKEECFGKIWYNFSINEQDAIVEKLLNEENEQNIIDWLIDHHGLEESKATFIANISLVEGYGRLSKVALDKILPKLIEAVITYDEAVKKAELGSHSALSHAQQTGEIMDVLPYYGEPLSRHVAFQKSNPRNDEERFGKIANPTVHIGLNELRKVTNGIIKRYGHPAEIVVEVTRELKVSSKRKAELQKEQKDRQEKNKISVDEACEALGLNPETLDRSKRRELSQKMQLWCELNPKDPTNRCCPYSGEKISIDRLLSEEVEIEHILPYSKTLDDSMSNKTVCMRKVNRIKGNRTPYRAFGIQIELGYDYDAILQRAKDMPKNKRWRFTKDGDEICSDNDQDFLARSLNDTAYLSRIAKEYLSLICPPNRVRAIPGRMTALLRGKFGLNRLLSEDEEKNRNDHRHHALDAAVIGITDQGLLQRFSEASARAESLSLNRLVDNMPLPWPTYREQVKQALQHITVSHRPDHGYQGSMHEETAWGFREDGSVTRLVREESSDHRVRQKERKNLVGVNSSKDSTRHKKDKYGNILPYKGYVGGSNYCLEIWADEKGKWQGDVISTFLAYQIVRRLGEKAGIERLRDPALTQSEKLLVMRLMINDYVALEINGIKKLMRVVKLSGNGMIYFAEPHEANVDARNRDNANPFKYITKCAGSLQKTNAQLITVSPVGKIST